MDPIVTQEPYTFVNVKHTPSTGLLTTNGYRITYTPSTAQSKRKGSRILYTDACSGLLRHLLPKGGRILDLSPVNGEFAIACNSIPTVSYTGVDPREEMVALLRDNDIKTERITFIDTQAGVDREATYDCMIVNLDSIRDYPRQFLSTEGVLIIRGTESDILSPQFKDCWSLPLVQLYGIVGVRNTEGSCDALFLGSQTAGRIDLPEPTGGSQEFISQIKNNPFPAQIKPTTFSYRSRPIPCLSDHPYACIQYTVGLNSIKGVIIKRGNTHPLTHLGLYNLNYSGKFPITLHVFEYSSDNPNRTFVYIQDDINVYVHTHKTQKSCETHAKYIIGDNSKVIGMGDDTIAIDMIADGITRIMEREYPLVEIRGVNDLLAKGVAQAYSQSDIRVSMSSCEPSTLTYSQKTRVSSRLFFTNDLGKKIPSMIVNPEEPEFDIGTFTTDQLIKMVELNIPKYANTGDGEFIPTSPIVIEETA